MELSQHLGRASINKVHKSKMGEVLVTEDLLGIEVELENIADVANCPKSWTVHADGSLRNRGQEFVFTHPLGGGVAEQAIYDFDGYMKKFNPNARNSPRTSTHIHINVDDLDEVQLVKFAALYLMYERHIFRAYSPERESNHYCVPLSQCDGMIESLRNLYLNRSWRSFLAAQRNEEGGRYGAFNMMAIPKFGSIEFRHFTGSTSAEQLMSWSNVILLLKQFAKVNRIDLKELLNDVSRTGYVNFTYQTFEKKVADKFIRLPSFDQMMVDGIRLVQTIIHPTEMKVPADIEKFVKNRQKELKSKREAARKLIADKIEATRGSLQESYEKGGFAALEKAEAAAKAEAAPGRLVVGGGEVVGGRLNVDVEANPFIRQAPAPQNPDDAFERIRAQEERRMRELMERQWRALRERGLV